MNYLRAKSEDKRERTRVLKPIERGGRANILRTHREGITNLFHLVEVTWRDTIIRHTANELKPAVTDRDSTTRDGSREILDGKGRDIKRCSARSLLGESLKSIEDRRLQHL
jgi:hypothetical protein